MQDDLPSVRLNEDANYGFKAETRAEMMINTVSSALDIEIMH